jgi:hypothetical protein
MAELALDVVEGHSPASELERVRMAQLMRRGAPPDSGAGGEPAELAADGGA